MGVQAVVIEAFSTYFEFYMPLKSAGEVWYLLQSDCCNWGHLEKADQLNNRKITNIHFKEVGCQTYTVFM